MFLTRLSKAKLHSDSYDQSPVTWDDDQLEKLPQNVMMTTKRIKQRLLELIEKLNLDGDMFTWSFCSD